MTVALKIPLTRWNDNLAINAEIYLDYGHISTMEAESNRTAIKLIDGTNYRVRETPLEIRMLAVHEARLLSGLMDKRLKLDAPLKRQPLIEVLVDVNSGKQISVINGKMQA